MAQAKATLANAQAVQGRTELDVNRYTPLAREQAASQQDLDNAIQNNLAAKATVATAEAQIQDRLRLPLKRPRSISILPGSLRPSTASPGRLSFKWVPWSIRAAGR